MSHDPEPRLHELLADAAHDDGRPLPFTAAELTRRGRRARRRRTATVAGGALLAVAAVTGGAVALTGGRPGTDGHGQVADPVPTSAPRVGPAPTTYPDAAGVTRQCDAVGDRTSPHLAADGWSVDAEASDARGTIATFVSPDATQWATCTLYGGGTGSLTAPGPLPTTPVPQSWRGNPPERDGGVEFGPGCADPKDHPCSTRDYSVDGPLRPGTSQVRLTSPSGEQPVVRGQHTYVARFVEQEPADGSGTPPMLVTLLAADGSTIIRYDLNGAMR